MANPLIPGNTGPAPAGQPASIGDMLEQSHQSAQAMYAQTSKHIAMLDKVDAGLQNLAKLGDSITTDNVIEEAGNLIGAGFGPHDMAAMLADMPQGGQALAAWVQQHVQAVEANRAQATQMHDVIRHEVGVSAANMLLHHPAHNQGTSATPATVAPQTDSPAPSAGNMLTSLAPQGNA